MKLLVCGGRGFLGIKRVYDKLDAVLKETGVLWLVVGDATGVDKYTAMWARKNNVRCDVYVADWGMHGKAAGPIRNMEMLAVGKPEKILAFKGGKGTAHMMRIALEAGIPIEEVA